MEEVAVALGFAELSGVLDRWPKGCRSILVSTKSAYDLYGVSIEEACQRAGWSCGRYLYPCGEEAKDLAHTVSCWAAMQELGLDRQSVMLCLGGGALTDAAGFAASCYMRGIDLLMLPTTLLGMIDAAVGGKNGINFGDLKNAVGTFHLPRAIYANLACLNSLPDREFRAGLAEAIKAAFIWDPTLIPFLNTHMDDLLQHKEKPLAELIHRCIKVKQEVVKQDPRDTSLRAILNFGHTTAHALERAKRSIGDQILHGEAVAIGMNVAAQLGVKLGITPPTVATQLEALCQQAGLPTELPVPATELIPWMRRDKKAVQERLSFILLRELGKAELVQDIQEEWLL